MEERGALFDDGAKASIDAARKVHRAIWRIMIKDGMLLLGFSWRRFVQSD